MIKNNAIFKIAFKLKELLFGKYYDQSILRDLDRCDRSDIFPADMILLRG